jgi:transcriptional regulator PpsR
VNTVSAPPSELLLQHLASLQFLINENGIVIDATINGPSSTLQPEELIGRPLSELVTDDSGVLLASRIEEARRNKGVAVRCDTSIEPRSGNTVPLLCWICAETNSSNVKVAAIDLLPEASLRHQLLNAQHAMERDYWSKRRLEARYRRLLDMVSEGFIVVDDSSGRILEANPMAATLLVGAGATLVGKPFPQGLDEEARNTLEGLTREARSVTTTIDGMISTDGGLELNIAITYLRQSGEGRLLIRLRDDSERDLKGVEFQSFFTDAPDGILELDEQGIVLAANNAFLDMAGILSPELVEGRRADRWIGRSAVDLNIVLDHSKQEGSVRLYSTTLRTETESSVDIELSVSRVGKNSSTRVMLFVRDIGRRITPDQSVDDHLPRSIEQITGRVGRVPLKELVRESTDVIEALCIEAALKLTSGNRASAAELLGLSRQSLYTKLRRFDLGDAEVDGDRDTL